MENKDKKIHIVGAGISGLIAAKILEEKGYAPILLEATDTPGGRVKTDTIDGVCYDHGFQVLLTGYTQAQKNLDYSELQLQRFKPGALIFKNGKSQRIGDPLRDISALFPTVFASVGTISDKLKIFSLTQKLKRKSIADIFVSEEKTTAQYLKGYGFSYRIISNFFQPFFTGIFLEEKLQTSSRLFEFVFKMFGEGYAALPQKGIGAITEQLLDQLNKSTFRYNTKVTQIQSNNVLLSNGETLPSDATIVTVPIQRDTGEISLNSVNWKRCDNLYFTVDHRTFEEGIIGLVADSTVLINNLYYPFAQTSNGNPILSVTVVKDHGLPEDALIEKVEEELQSQCGITTKQFLRKYTIAQALPDITNLQMELTHTKLEGLNGVYVAGDHLLSGSLNAAMASGEAAANMLSKDLD